MCMLTVFETPGLLSHATLSRLGNGAMVNDDGHGWAVVIGDNIVTGRSLDSEQALTEFEAAYANATGPALFHSRWATHGAADELGVHPFRVPRLGNTYLAHNGVMPAASLPGPGDWRSDTRVFAEDILPRKFPALDSRRTQRRLSAFLGYNKVAVLTTDPRFSRRVYIVGWDLGHVKDDVWYSNDDYEGKWWRHFPPAKTDDAAPLGAPVDSLTSPRVDDECVWCRVSCVNEYNVCEACGTCQDCYEPYRHCECAIPAPSRPERKAHWWEDCQPLGDAGAWPQRAIEAPRTDAPKPVRLEIAR